MRLKNRICSFLMFLLLITSTGLEAQLSLSMYFDAGKNNVSEGLYIKTAAIGDYEFGKNYVGGGVQFDLKSPGTDFISATSLEIGREFSIKNFPFEIEGLIHYSRFSDLLYEYNLGVSGKVKLDHFDFRLGTHFRTYMITKDAVEEYSIEKHKKIHENWNLLYLVAYRLKPVDHEWNVFLSVTNIDHFIINQETNPVLFLRGEYRVSDPLNIFSELWYKTAGSLNLSVNHFGFFVRTGIVWDIEL